MATLRQGIEIMLEISKDNPDTRAKARFMTKWIRKYFKEKGYKNN